MFITIKAADVVALFYEERIVEVDSNDAVPLYANPPADQDANSRGKNPRAAAACQSHISLWPEINL